MAEKIRKKWTKITEQCFLHGCVVGWFQQYVYLAGQQQGGVTSSSPQRNSNALPLDTVHSPHHRLQFLPNPLCGYPRENIMYCGAQLFLVNSLPKFHVVTQIPQVLDRTGKSLFHSWLKLLIQNSIISGSSIRWLTLRGQPMGSN